LTLANIQAKKSLGQNFLVDPGIAQRIVDSCKITKDDIVLEIGPGQGALTGRLLAVAAKVIAVEIDDRCADLLVEQFNQPNFQLIRGDVLRLNIQYILRDADPAKTKRLRVVANLPYNISTPVIQHFLPTTDQRHDPDAAKRSRGTDCQRSGFEGIRIAVDLRSIFRRRKKIVRCSSAGVQTGAKSSLIGCAADNSRTAYRRCR
jgi:hypothetical protein